MSIEVQDGAQHFLSFFSDPEAVARYAEGPPRFVPGFDALHRITYILLAERAPADAKVLVLGAGGGLELGAMAEAHPGSRFVGVDPAEAMLNLAAGALGPLADRVELVQGYIEDAPEEPFDAATCHCGAVTLSLAAWPTEVTDCNCSQCRSYGVIWAYCSANGILREPDPSLTETYAWNGRHVDFHRC